MTDRPTPHALLLVADGYDDLTLWYPKLRLEEARLRTTVAGIEADGLYTGRNGMPAIANEAVRDLRASDFDALVISGGWLPDRRPDADALLALVRAMDAAGAAIAAIGHGVGVLRAAGLVKGRKLTSSPGVREDLEYAGARWVAGPVAVDGRWVTARSADALPELTAALLRLFDAT